jgi:hypothetical protein
MSFFFFFFHCSLFTVHCSLFTVLDGWKASRENFHLNKTQSDTTLLSLLSPSGWLVGCLRHGDDMERHKTQALENLKAKGRKSYFMNVTKWLRIISKAYKQFHIQKGEKNNTLSFFIC